MRRLAGSAPVAFIAVVDETGDALVTDSVLKEKDQSILTEPIKQAPDIGVEYAVHAVSLIAIDRGSSASC